MSFNKSKSDYIALQNLWYTCSDNYLKTNDKSMRVRIIDDFRDTLVDITPDGCKSIRSLYKKWEENVWLPLCKKQLDMWAYSNPFEARVYEQRKQEENNIKEEFNHLRYRMILQIIQDSGIGLGQGKNVKMIERSGFKG